MTYAESRRFACPSYSSFSVVLSPPVAPSLICRSRMPVLFLFACCFLLFSAGFLPYTLTFFLFSRFLGRGIGIRGVGFWRDMGFVS